MAPNLIAEHIRRFESRIGQQTALIKRLQQSGRDTSDAERTLALLRQALEEMRVQLGKLSPTRLDAKRTAVAAALKQLSDSQKKR